MYIRRSWVGFLIKETKATDDSERGKGQRKKNSRKQPVDTAFPAHEQHAAFVVKVRSMLLCGRIREYKAVRVCFSA